MLATVIFDVPTPGTLLWVPSRQIGLVVYGILQLLATWASDISEGVRHLSPGTPVRPIVCRLPADCPSIIRCRELPAGSRNTDSSKGGRYADRYYVLGLGLIVWMVIYAESYRESARRRVIKRRVRAKLTRGAGWYLAEHALSTRREAFPFLLEGGSRVIDRPMATVAWQHESAGCLIGRMQRVIQGGHAEKTLTSAGPKP